MVDNNTCILFYCMYFCKKKIHSSFSHFYYKILYGQKLTKRMKKTNITISQFRDNLI